MCRGQRVDVRAVAEGFGSAQAANVAHVRVVHGAHVQRKHLRLSCLGKLPAFSRRVFYSKSWRVKRRRRRAERGSIPLELRVFGLLRARVHVPERGEAAGSVPHH